ncbi:MAG: hypothetical protein NTW15_15790 [Burkholderiales bacterium]|nr:hypothetical protein [Burkholderiales bacterium]
MRRTRLFLLLLLLGALQGLGPLLHAHRDALAFAGGIHLPGMSVDAPTTGSATDRTNPDPGGLAFHADRGAYVTALSGIGERERLEPVGSAPSPDASPQPGPAREGRAAQPPPVGAPVFRTPHLRPSPQAPPRA